MGFSLLYGKAFIDAVALTTILARMRKEMEAVLPRMTMLQVKWGCKYKSKKGLFVVTGGGSKQTSSPGEARGPCPKGGIAIPSDFSREAANRNFPVSKIVDCYIVCDCKI